MTIKGGNYNVGADATGLGNSCIYVLKGNAVIDGGQFETAAMWNKRYWTLNCKNNSESTITVNGGIIVGQNPAEPNTDDKAGAYSYVAAGKTATKLPQQINGKDAWEVK